LLDGVGTGLAMRRREFISLFGSVAAAWPLDTRAQQLMRRIGVLFPLSSDDPEVKVRLDAFISGLQENGWEEGRSVILDIRYGDGDSDRIRTEATGMIRSKPDVILASGTQAAIALRRTTREFPIVFVNVADPVAGGLVTSLARPSENITGFTSVEAMTSGKWFDLLKELAPLISRVLFLFRSNTPEVAITLPTVESVAASFGMTITLGDVSDRDGIVRAIEAFEQGPGTGMIVMPSPITAVYRTTIITLAAEHHIPTVYPYRYFVADGGLVSYGVDLRYQFRQAAFYINRILHGEKPSDLPVQQPTKFELAINLKTAKALGLTVPPLLLARADQVIE
jgi:putative tryptophan/tyrosine transport system substrate-binding protein